MSPQATATTLRDVIAQDDGLWTEGPYRLWRAETLLKQAGIASFLAREVTIIDRKIWFVPTESQAYYQQSAWQKKEALGEVF